MDYDEDFVGLIPGVAVFFDVDGGSLRMAGVDREDLANWIFPCWTSPGCLVRVSGILMIFPWAVAGVAELANLWGLTGRTSRLNL